MTRRVAVVGAGILGAALADRLAAAGAHVTVLEQHQPGTGASRSSLAWYNANSKTPHAYHRLNVAGMHAWAALAPRLGGAAWHRPTGNLEWAEDSDGRAQLYSRVQRLRAWGYAARLVGRNELLGLEPSLHLPGGVWEGAWFPDEGYLLTDRLIAHLLGRAAAAGAVIRTGRAGAVTAIDPRPGTTTYTLRTADGEHLPADALALCAGLGTPHLAALLGAQIPLLAPDTPSSPVPGLVVHIGPPIRPPARVLHGPHITLRPHAPNTVHLEAPDLPVAPDTPPEELDALAEKLLDRARTLIPDLIHATVQSRTVCNRPFPSDSYPIIGELPNTPNTYVLTTHSGVTLAAHLAALATQELLTDTRHAELAPYRPERFA
jgi:glycine/D-amino acid oxidase-like deaminating enzyme